MMKTVNWIYLILVVILIAISPVPGQGAMGGSGDWGKVVQAAKKEGKVVVSFPSSAALRKAAHAELTKRYGIELELIVGRGSKPIRRIVKENKAGLHYFDIHVGGVNSITRGLVRNKILEPVEPRFVLPEVKDPKQWWGGHMWIDNAQRYVYGFQAYLTENIWYNTDMVKPEDLGGMTISSILNGRAKLAFSIRATRGLATQPGPSCG